MPHTWKTRDGRRIPIQELTNDHLANVIRLLQRRREHWLDSALANFPSFQGEYAQMFAEQAWDENHARAVEHVARIDNNLSILRREAQRRSPHA